VGPGRNDPCPCGSGKRFKQCCGALTSGAAAAETPPPQAGGAQPPPGAPGAQPPPSAGALAQMIARGRPREAEREAQAQLERDPSCGVLWKILGVALAHQGKDPLPALRRAAELLPEDAEAHRNLGAALHGGGWLEEALPSLHRALALEPRNVPVLLATGTTLCALGRAPESLPLFEQALAIDPRLAEAENNLGNALQDLGDYAQAASRYRRALALRPDDAEIHCNLSNALRRLGQLDEAVASARRAVALAPGLSMAHNNLGLALAALGQLAEAAASLRQAVQLNARFVEAVDNLGKVLRDLGDSREALACYRRAVALDPQRADTHCHLGEALCESGELAEAVASFRRALAQRTDHAQAHLGLAAALRLQNEADGALASCRAALSLEPDSAAALTLLGDLHVDRGEFAQAQELFERARAVDPDFAPAFCSIAAQRRMTGADTAWLEGATALLAKSLPPAHTIGLHYALGKYHDDIGRYDEAFRHYRQANELGKRSGPVYQAAQLSRQVDETIGMFDRAFVRASHGGASLSELPVFVIGMPRSGTSLTEQILASHPQVFGAGEVEFWDQAFAAFRDAGPASEAAAAALAKIAREYLARVSAVSGAAPRVVDKMPANFLYAGLIHVAFPRARILHMQRHPIDTCVSIYFQNFSALRPYANDLENLAHYYCEYLRISRHWRAVLPDSIFLEIPYEALVEDQQYWTRRMLEFIGLPWDPRCLDFHRTERVVITASRWQVRQRIHTGSIGRWHNYEQQIAPLKQLVDLVESAAPRTPQRALQP
jgi:tetratricopeptide (TPR) repeat protein